jgi:hypothetical protein
VTAFTAAQKRELRASIAQSIREARAQSRERKASQPPKSPVQRAAEHAERASQAKQIAKDIVGPPRPPDDHCQVCGAPAKGDLCLAHSDLSEGT